jgi:cysteine desulfuration protein SufE
MNETLQKIREGACPPCPRPTARTDTRSVAAPAWFGSQPRKSAGSTALVLRFQGDSDAHIVRGLIAILFAIYSGKTVDDVLGTDGQAIFAELGLKEHVTPQRSNGFAAMLERIRSDARAMADPRPEPASHRLELERSWRLSSTRLPPHGRTDGRPLRSARNLSQGFGH